MASRRLALVGAAQGPLVYVAEVPEPRLRITGLLKGVVTLRRLLPDGKQEEHEYSENGVYPLETALWAQLRCTPPCKSVVCMITSASVV